MNEQNNKTSNQWSAGIIICKCFCQKISSSFCVHYSSQWERCFKLQNTARLSHWSVFLLLYFTFSFLCLHHIDVFYNALVALHLKASCQCFFCSLQVVGFFLVWQRARSCSCTSDEMSHTTKVWKTDELPLAYFRLDPGKVQRNSVKIKKCSNGLVCQILNRTYCHFVWTVMLIHTVDTLYTSVKCFTFLFVQREGVWG